MDRALNVTADPDCLHSRVDGTGLIYAFQAEALDNDPEKGARVIRFDANRSGRHHLLLQGVFTTMNKYGYTFHPTCEPALAPTGGIELSTTEPCSIDIALRDGHESGSPIRGIRVERGSVRDLTELEMKRFARFIFLP